MRQGFGARIRVSLSGGERLDEMTSEASAYAVTYISKAELNVGERGAITLGTGDILSSIGSEDVCKRGLVRQ